MTSLRSFDRSLPMALMRARESTMRSFDRSLPMALMRARESTMRSFRPVLASYDLTEQQWRVLRALADANGPLDVGDLIECTFLLGPSLSRILLHLETRALIKRRPSPNDQRRAEIELSTAGGRLVATVGPASEAVYTQLEARLGPECLELLYGLLDDLTVEPMASAAKEVP